jgi:hypothetical protein
VDNHYQPPKAATFIDVKGLSDYQIH